MYNIGIIGYGVVGQGIHRLFTDSVKAIYDPYISFDHKTTSSKYGLYLSEGDTTNKDLFKDLDMVVISVMTKENQDGTCDMGIVEESMKWLSEIGYKGIVLVKSTSLPMALVRMRLEYGLRVVFSPEYMGESKYFTPFWKYPDPVDMKYHDFQTFGGFPEDTSECVNIFIRVMGPHVKYHQTTLETAALAKYMENIFFATKVTFCNEFYDIAKTYGVDYNELRELWLLDTRISPMHTAVFPKDRGFGGKCYPKDLHALMSDVKSRGYTPKLLEAVDAVNKEMRNVNSN